VDQEQAAPKPEPRTSNRPGLDALEKSVKRLLNRNEVERLAFETDPNSSHQYQSVYRPKLRGVPEHVAKRIAVQDDLVAAIIRARCHQVSNFGRPRFDRFGMGYVLEPTVGVVDRLDDEGKAQLDKQIDQAVKRLWSCGDEDAFPMNERMTFAQYLEMSTYSASGVGRIATELVWKSDPSAMSGKKFVGFRPIDAGTVFFSVPQRKGADVVRQQAKHLLQQLKTGSFDGKGIDVDRFQKDEYAWIQVIEQRPVQAFTAQECVVHNFYPVPDVEWDGYPVTPLDNAIAAVTTHLNITNHNRLYFQNGRASRGMLVIKSDDVDDDVIKTIRQQFNASINNSSNAWRMPVFGIGPGDELSWQAIDTSSRDMEFQYLTDMNARTILSAFQMSPDELPGWTYLSRGTNNQALSESSNEYKLEAARDLGIRPMLAKFEDFVNAVIMPLIAPEIHDKVRFRMIGLEAETEEKESVRLQQDMPLHMTMDQLLSKVEKKPYGKEWGGEFPLNPAFQKQVLDPYLTVGEILEKFFGRKGASQDPNLQYRRDPMWFQQQQMIQQAKLAQMQVARGQPPGGGGGGGGGGSEGSTGGEENPEAAGNADVQQPQHEPTEKQKTAQAEDSTGNPPKADLERSLQEAADSLSKGERHLPPGKRILLENHKRLVDGVARSLEADAHEAVGEILAQADDILPERG
jgi:hypothetical protein